VISDQREEAAAYNRHGRSRNAVWFGTWEFCTSSSLQATSSCDKHDIARVLNTRYITLQGSFSLGTHKKTYLNKRK
jgi:hypothetical protein